MKRTATVLLILVLLAFPLLADEGEDVEVTLDFSGLVPKATYVVEMSGISIVGSVTGTSEQTGVMGHDAYDAYLQGRMTRSSRDRTTG